MDRRTFVTLTGSAAGAILASGCRSYQYGHIIKPGSANMVGSHTAGAEVFDPLIGESVAKLLGRQSTQDNQSIGPDGMPCKKTICFVGVENKSIEELGDFKDQIYQQIDTKIIESNTFDAVSKRMIDAALHETRLRPESLFLPANRELFFAVMQRDGQPVDYLMFATLTSGSTERNSSTQRDYLLTLEMVNLHTGYADKVSEKIAKGYHRSVMGKWWNFNPMRG